MSYAISTDDLFSGGEIGFLGDPSGTDAFEEEMYVSEALSELCGDIIETPDFAPIADFDLDEHDLAA